MKKKTKDDIVLSGQTSKLKAMRDCTVAKNDIKNDLVFKYKFKSGETKEIPDEHKKILLDTGIFKEEK